VINTTKESMISKTIVSGRIIKKYKIPLNQVEELNKKYEDNKHSLESKGAKLAGRLDSELESTKVIQSLPIFETIKKCMNEYMISLNHFSLTPKPMYNLKIITMWINDMQPHEYNPIHTHHDGTGWSTVMFLKVPNFINDAKHKHKFRDGALGFIFPENKTMFYEPSVGDFYIFEASHQHFVLPYKTNDSDPTRRSMSFNFITDDD
jgi:hypothetical protein